MKPIQTGIAVALGLAIVVVILVLPGFASFHSPNGSSSVSAGEVTNVQTASITMPIQNSDQLQMTDTTVGTGTIATTGDTVTVNYVGSLENGAIFDASANHGTQGFTFTLGAGQVIKGWDKGIAGMKVGGKRKLIIPASLAYGDQAVGNVIPAHATLLFEVELLNVRKAGQ